MAGSIVPARTAIAEPEPSRAAPRQATSSAAPAFRPEDSLEHGERTGDSDAWEELLGGEGSLERREQTGDIALFKDETFEDEEGAFGLETGSDFNGSVNEENRFAGVSAEAEARPAEEWLARSARQSELIEQGLLRIANSKALVERQRGYHQEVHGRLRAFMRLALWMQDLRLADVDSLWGAVDDDLDDSEAIFHVAIDQLLSVDTVVVPTPTTGLSAEERPSNSIDMAIADGNRLWESARKKYYIANDNYEVDLKFISDQQPLPHEVVGDTVFGTAAEIWEGGFAKNFELASMGSLGLFIGFGKGFLDLLVTLRTLMEPEVFFSLLGMIGDAATLVVSIVDLRKPLNERMAAAQEVIKTLKDIGLGVLESIEEEWERIKRLEPAMQALAIGEVFGRIISDLASGGLGKSGVKGLGKLVAKTPRAILDVTADIKRFGKGGMGDVGSISGMANGGRLTPDVIEGTMVPNTFLSKIHPNASGSGSRSTESLAKVADEGGKGTVPTSKIPWWQRPVTGGASATEGGVLGVGVEVTKENVIDMLAERYAAVVNNNVKWTWFDDFGGYLVPTSQRPLIKERAIERGLLKRVPKKPGTDFPDFEAAGLLREVANLPREYWKMGDSAQFAFLNKKYSGVQPPGTSWHHSEIPGRMELVDFGYHNVINHRGGRSPGMWAHAPR